MPTDASPDLSLFFDILQTLEDIAAPYMIIGAFAATLYGSTRVTYDIDIVVDLSEEHIEALAAAYPLPRYYADPQQMRDSVRLGTMFNIIDSTLGEKADLVPLTMAAQYREAFARRIRQHISVPGIGAFDVWCARADDVIVGKLLAWAEGRSRKHEIDLIEMMVASFLDADPMLAATLDIPYVTARAAELGDDVVAFWQAIVEAARRQAEEEKPSSSLPPS